MRRGGGCERCAQTRLVGAHSVCPFQELLSLLDELPDDAAYGVVLFRRQLVLVVFSSVHKPVLTLYLFVKNVSEVLRCQKILKSTNPEQNQSVCFRRMVCRPARFLPTEYVFHACVSTGTQEDASCTCRYFLTCCTQYVQPASYSSWHSWLDEHTTIIGTSDPCMYLLRHLPNKRKCQSRVAITSAVLW